MGKETSTRSVIQGALKQPSHRVASECRPGLLNLNNSEAFDVWVSSGNANVASFFTACLQALQSRSLIGRSGTV